MATLTKKDMDIMFETFQNNKELLQYMQNICLDKISDFDKTSYVDINPKDMRPYNNYRQFDEDFIITSSSAPSFGRGKNGEHFGGRKVIKFTIRNKFVCEYEEILRETSRSAYFRYGLNIDYYRKTIYTDLDYSICNSFIKNSFIKNKITEKTELYECLTMMGKIYNLTPEEIIEAMGRIIEAHFY